jgi:hypothetical protein
MLTDGEVTAVGQLMRSGRILVAVYLPELSWMQESAFVEIASRIAELPETQFCTVRLDTCDWVGSHVLNEFDDSNSSGTSDLKSTNLDRLLFGLQIAVAADHTIYLGPWSPVIECRPDIDLYCSDQVTGISIEIDSAIPHSPFADPLGDCINVLHYLTSLRQQGTAHSSTAV